MNIRLRTLLVWVALVILSMTANLQTSSEPSSLSSALLNHPEIIESAEIKESAQKILTHGGNLLKGLKNIFGNRKIAPDFHPKDINLQANPKSDSLEQLGAELILNSTQLNLVLINSTTIMTASATNFSFFTLNVVNLVDKTMFSKVYRDMNASLSELAMKLLDQRSVAIYLKNNFMIVNIADLSIRQTIVLSEVAKEQNLKAYGDVYYIENYVKNESGVLRNTIVLGYQGVLAHVLEYNYKTNQYERTNQVYKPSGDYFLTDSDEGVSFWNYNKVSTSFKEGFKIFDQNTPLNFQNYEIFVVSNSEEFVVTTYEAPSYYSHIKLFSLNKTNYNLKDVFTIDLPTKLKADVAKIRFTNDNKNLFVNIRQDYEKFRSVGVISLETGKLTYFDFDGENRTGPYCFDYGILDDTRFILVCGSGQDTSYQLRLYNSSNFRLIDTYTISAETSNLEIKTNPNFNLSFFLQILNENAAPKLQFFKVINNRITLSSMNLTNFKIVTQCLNYLVGIFGEEAYHSFININNFQIVKKTPRYDVNQKYSAYGPKEYFVQNNVLGICTGKIYFYKCQMVEFYDLSKIERPGSEWETCNFFAETLTNFYFFLHKEIYVFERGENSNTTKGFDLQKCQTKKIVPLQIPKQQEQEARSVLYKRGTSCNTAYLDYTPNIIFTLQDCQPYQAPIKTNIRTSGFNEHILKTQISSNGKYIILILCWKDPTYPFYCQHRYDVRLANDLERSVLKTGVFYCSMVKDQLFCQADVNENDQLVYLTQTGLFLEKLVIKDDNYSAGTKENNFNDVD